MWIIHLQFPLYPRFLVLIDTWWNVNQGNTNSSPRSFFVLIDTWWNVNTLRSPDAKTDSTVLIDTWWNVNISNWCSNRIRYLCFNRYMVECESTYNDLKNVTTESFNRYMVECEWTKAVLPDTYGEVLIDTWWNVNSFTSNLTA